MLIFGGIQVKQVKVSNNVIRRLPRYLRKLDELKAAGVDRISSGELGRQMGLTSSQIRQDFSCFGEFGQQGYGYNVESLKAEIAQILGMNQKHTAILLGVGNLGRALVQNFSFRKSGFSLIAAFDPMPGFIETEFGTLHVYSNESLDAFLQEHKVDIAVLTIPQAAACSTARHLVEAGVRGIWNFTNVELNLDNPDVVVENVHFADSLLALSYMISE